MEELYLQPGYNLNAMNIWMNRIDNELANAISARETGNEGRARVCARRAAGIAAREWLARHGIPVRGASAYDALKALADSPGLLPEQRMLVLHLTMSVDEDFHLPDGVDLIADARQLCGQLSASLDK